MDVCRLGLVMTVALVTRTKLLYTLKSNPAVTEMRWVTGHGCTASVCNEPLRPTQPPTLSGQEMSACQGAVAAMRHGSTHGLKAYKEGRLAPRLHSLRNMAPFTFFTCIVSKALKIDSSASSRFQWTEWTVHWTYVYLLLDTDMQKDYAVLWCRSVFFFLEYQTSSSAAAERPREPLSQLKSCQLLHNCTKNHIWLEGLPFHAV